MREGEVYGEAKVKCIKYVCITGNSELRGEEMIKKLIFYFLFFFLLLPLLGQWRWNDNGLPVSSDFSFAESHLLATDGEGGAIVAWMDYGRKGYGMYAQRLNRQGKRLWNKKGVSVYTGSPVGDSFVMVADGKGGVIFAWRLARMGNYHIFAQRINALGDKLWGKDGSPVCIEPHGQISPKLTPDGSGGAIFAWNDFRLADSNDIFAQRLNAKGNPCWLADGIPICTAANGQWPLTMKSDYAGDAILAWTDYRSGSDANIFAQRVSRAGTLLWPVDGVAICSDPAAQNNPQVITDGAKGAIIVWSDIRSGIVEIYAQRIAADGSGLWAENGVPIVSRSNDQYMAAITGDGSGGAIIAWVESLYHDSTYHDVYAQRLDSSGNPLWTVAGIPVCTASGDQLDPDLVADQSGGAIIAWNDGRNLGPSRKIYSAKLDAQGALQWGENGIRVSLNNDSQDQPRLVADGRGGAIAIWQDVNAIGSIYAQRLLPLYTVNFIANVGGTIVGNSSQKVLAGANCVRIRAVPRAGYRFHCWSGTGEFYSTDNPLRVTRVLENMAIRADFTRKTTSSDSKSP
jgi:hypothetical protein